MSGRTSINVDKDSHTEASDVKDEYGETWPEVLQWYAEHRPQENTDRVTTTGDDPLAMYEDFRDVVQETIKKTSSSDNNLSEQLDRIESGVKEATNAAQSADRKLEDLGR